MGIRSPRRIRSIRRSPEFPGHPVHREITTPVSIDKDEQDSQPPLAFLTRNLKLMGKLQRTIGSVNSQTSTDLFLFVANGDCSIVRVVPNTPGAKRGGLNTSRTSRSDKFFSMTANSPSVAGGLFNLRGSILSPPPPSLHELSVGRTLILIGSPTYP